MIERTISRRYAKALLDVSIPEQRVRETQQELEGLAALVRTSPEFRTALTSPVIPRRRRQEAARSALAGRVGASLVGFLRVLIEEDRAALLPEIAEVYDDLADAQEGVVEAKVRSARPLPPDQIERLRRTIERFTRGRRVEIEAETDPELIGGLTVRVGDAVVDGSLTGWLKRTRDRLLRQTE